MDQVTFENQVREALAACRRNVASFVERPSQGFSKDLADYDALFAPLSRLGGRISLYVRAHPEPAMREVCTQFEQELSELQTEVSLDRELYKRLQELKPTEEASLQERRLLAHALRDFKRAGVDRDEATRERLRELQQEMVVVGQEFNINIIQASTEFCIEAGHAGLAGLPEDFIAAHPEREDGSVVISTDAVDRIPFMTYAEDDELRRRYLYVCSNLAREVNPPVLRRLLELRHEMATLLGYAHWADYVTEDKMVKSALAAGDFLKRVIASVAPRSAQDFEALLEEKRRTQPGASEVFEWESAFLAERVKRRLFAYDSQEARPYLAYDKVRDGILEVSASLYGVSFVEVLDADVWHASVQCFDMLDGEEPIARFYLDMHPRADKFKHGAMFPLISGPSGGLPEGALMCNFPEPSASDPGLLQHSEVTTFFHEFGHLLHQLFAGHQSRFGFSGIACEFDFVEVPSQMYEEWARDPGILARFAHHHQSGEPIPEELVQRMRAASSFGLGLGTMRQMVFASLSLAYYDRDPAQVDLEAMMIETKARLVSISQQEDTHFYASFGHLNGYSAIYYTYMWSLVISKDFLGRFEPDLLSTEVASEYRAKVLEQGGAKDAEEMVEDFLGRPYAFEAFERYLQE